MLGRTLIALGAVLALLPATARAALIQERGPLLSATNGIALGPDGNLWVTEEFNGSVVRMTPGGTVLNRYSVGNNPTSVTAGAGGSVWVSIPGANKLVWFDATAGTPTAHDGPTGLACGPVAVVDGGDGRIYFSMPACGRIGSVKADGTDLAAPVAGRGTVYDLAVSSGKLFAPDFDNNLIRRMPLSATLPVEAVASTMDSPDGIAASSDGTLWITLYGSGRVAKLAPGFGNGTPATELTPTGGTLSGAFGIVAGNDGRIYVTGKDSANVARVDASGNWQFFPTGGQPWQIVNGPDGDLFFTDQSSTRILRFLSGPPRASTGVATAVAASAASASATVDTRGNATQVVFDYGPTSTYGATTAPVTLPAADGGAPVTVVLSGLAAGTTYHVRVRATNEEGSVAGADTSFATPPVPLKVLTARATFGWAFVGARTALRKVEITGLAGGETAKVTCKGKGCPFKSKTYKNLKKGKKSLSSRFGLKRKLAKGTKVTILVTKPGAIGTNALLTVRGRKQDPKITRSCLQPGAKKTSRCPT